MPATVWFGGSNAIKDSIKYKYDSCGNISGITDEGKAVSYTYDKLNRLIREDNEAFGESYYYSYDTKGNITKKETSPYTTGDFPHSSASVINYAYNGDKLTLYNGASCTYDGVGNPVIYRGQAATWQGRKLTSLGGVTFTYDGKGRRISKNNVTYTYDSKDRLIAGNAFEFYYDDNGLTGFVYCGCLYYYQRDMQGNIIAILDSNGNLIVKYRYDAWGNHKVLDASGNVITSASHIGNVNPFRYRGYFYDIETGLYYLKTRYYDPVTGRFLNMDSIDYADPETINGLNLYAYCGNNPVMNVDPDGHFPILALILGITALVGMGLTIGGVASDNNTLTAVGLTLVAVPALISGGFAIAAGIGGATLTGIVGGVTVIAGIGSGLFASAEYQEAFTGNNWMLDAGMSEGWYNGLMLTTAAIATLGTFASSFCYNFNIKSIDKIGKLIPSNHTNEGYWGIRFKNARGALHSLELQNHVPHGLHFQLNKWNPMHMSVKTIRRWTWFLTRM